MGTVTGREREYGVGSWHSGTETRDDQVGECPCVIDGYSGLETGDARVGG